MRSIKAIVGDRSTITVEQRASVTAAAQVMSEHRVGAVPVVDGTRLVGVFSERDVLTRVVAARRDPNATTVGDVMTKDLIVAGLNESHEVCLRRMQQAQIRHLIVIDERDGEKRLAGIVSLRDILAADIDEKAEELTLLNAYVHFTP